MNVGVLVPVAAVVVVALGVVAFMLRRLFGAPEAVHAREWAHGGYSIWTGGEDCGDWDAARARDALRSWYGVQDSASFWSTIQNLRGGTTSNISWDQVRAIDLLRIGAAATYIDEDECWAEVSAIAGQLQERFDSWEAVAADFEAGMHAWQDGRGVTDPGQRGRVQRNLPYLRGTAWPEAPFKAPLEY